MRAGGESRFLASSTTQLGEVECGRWQSVSIWESEEHFNRFRDERLMPAAQRVLPAAMAQGGPPPIEASEAKHVLRP